MAFSNKCAWFKVWLFDYVLKSVLFNNIINLCVFTNTIYTVLVVLFFVLCTQIFIRKMQNANYNIHIKHATPNKQRINSNCEMHETWFVWRFLSCFIDENEANEQRFSLASPNNVNACVWHFSFRSFSDNGPLNASTTSRIII